MKADRVGRVIIGAGEAMTLKRSGQSDLAVRGRQRLYQAQEIVAEIQQGDREVRLGDLEIAAAAWPGPPKKGDQLVIAGHTTTVQSVETRTLGGATCMHVLRVRG